MSPRPFLTRSHQMCSYTVAGGIRIDTHLLDVRFIVDQIDLSEPDNAARLVLGYEKTPIGLGRKAIAHPSLRRLQNGSQTVRRKSRIRPALHVDHGLQIRHLGESDGPRTHGRQYYTQRA